MTSADRQAGAAVAHRLAPAGLSRLLGRHRSRRWLMAGVAALLFVAACGVLVLVPSRPFAAVLVFVFPVAIIASEMGTRAGLLAAAASIAVGVAWISAADRASSGTEIPRALALLFLAWVIGRTADRAARSSGLLEQVLTSTADAVYIKDLAGRYLAVNAPAAALLGRPAEKILGKRDAELLPGAATEVARHERAVIESDTSVTYDLPVHAADTVLDLSVTQSPFRDASGAVIGTLGVARDVTERRRFENELRRLADHDSLTGLLNRRRFAEILERHVMEVERYGPRGALLILDVDGFKRVNDSQGHQAGDRLIAGVAGILRSRLRRSDTIARIGGDEFAVLLPTGGPEEAASLAADLVRAFHEEADPVTAGVTASIGVAAFGAAGRTAAEMLVAADLAMYEAKAAGRDRFAAAPGL